MVVLARLLVQRLLLVAQALWVLPYLRLPPLVPMAVVRTLVLSQVNGLLVL
jgi:hypothetical protein